MTRSELLAILTATNPDRDSVYFDEERYIDWSTELISGIGRRIELGSADEGLSIPVDWPEIERLHRALTLLLLERDETTEA